MNKDLLKSAVYSRGLTMTVMAEKAGIPYATLSRHLAENNMPLVNVKKIADTLGLSREELLAIFFAD